MIDQFTAVLGIPTIDKTPQAILDYPINFADWLAYRGDGDAIASFTVTGQVGVTVDAARSHIADAYTKASLTLVPSGAVVLWVSGGIVGQPATVTVQITTTQQRTDVRTLGFNLVNR